MYMQERGHNESPNNFIINETLICLQHPLSSYTRRNCNKDPNTPD